MATVTLPLRIAVDPASLDAALASALSVGPALLTSDGAHERFVESLLGGVDLSDERLDLLVCELVDHSAGGATKLEALKLDPSDRYLEAVAAVARDGHANVFFRHGWPILSSVCCSTTIADGEGGATALPESPQRGEAGR